MSRDEWLQMVQILQHMGFQAKAALALAVCGDAVVGDKAGHVRPPHC